MIVYTEATITPHHAGFGMYQRGELQVGSETSFAVLSDLERAGDITPLADALRDPEFQAAGIQDIRGLIYNQPQHLYAKLQDGYEGKEVSYYGVEATEVDENFFN